MVRFRKPRFDMTVAPATVGELLYRLGDVDAERVIFDPVPGTATVEDLIAAENKPACELVAGSLIYVPFEFPDAILCSYLLMRLKNWVRTRNLGIVTGLKAPFLISPDTVRVADLAYTPWDRIPGRRIPKDQVAAVAPAMIIDFHRRAHTTVEIERKRSDFFQVGVDLYWLICGEKRLASVYTPDGKVKFLTPTDTLDGGEVLPGFSLPLAELFAELDRHG